MFFFFSQSILIISNILTKIYKITIACFKPTISVGLTLTHVRYYLDDPVHLLVSCAELQKCDCNFVDQYPSYKLVITKTREENNLINTTSYKTNAVYLFLMLLHPVPEKGKTVGR